MTTIQNPAKRATSPRQRPIARFASGVKAGLEAALKDDYGEFGRKYFYDFAGFIEDCVIPPPGETWADYQLQSARDLITYHRECIRSLHGAGKTTTAALACIWYALTRQALKLDWKIPMMASNGRHLSEFLWPEIHKWVNRIRWDRVGRDPWKVEVELLKEHIILANGRAFSMTSQHEAGIEGAHADHLFFMFDEAKQIADSFWDAAEGAFSGAGVNKREAYALAISTPGDPAGRFHDIQSHRPGFDDWHTTHWSLPMAIKAGRVTADWAERQKEKWGETHYLYKNRVLGEFAEQSGGVIPLSWIEAAIERGKQWAEAGYPGAMTAMGIDAGAGTAQGDLSVMAMAFDGVKIPDLRVAQIGDPHIATMEVAAQAAGILGKFNQYADVIVDYVGVGVGILHRLVEMNYKARGFAGSWSTGLMESTGELGFFNARCAAWFIFREMLAPDSGFDICLPDDPDLIADLTTPKMRNTTLNGRPVIQVESKESFMRRLKRSPDRGDAVIYAIVGPLLCDEHYAKKEGYQLVADPEESRW